MVFRRSVSDLNIALTLGNSESGNSESGNSESALPLDNISAVLAFSTARKLRTAYTGDAIRVRESGGDTEADIGFDANGDLDEAALLSHCGSNDGFITKWYDQSGDANAVDFVQATAADQPQIVSSGSVVKRSGKPAFDSGPATGGRNSVVLDTWGTRPSDATFLIVSETAPQARTGVIVPSAASAAKIGVYEDGSASTSLDAQAGSPTYAVSNAPLAGLEDQNALHDLLATSQIEIVEINSADLTGNSNFDKIATEDRTATFRDGLDYYLEYIVLSAPSTADKNSLRSDQATFYGVTLS